MPTIVSGSSWKTGMREKPVPSHHRRRSATLAVSSSELHVDAWHHDLAGDRVTELEHLANHALLLLEQGALLGDEELDLLLA